jgi:hypothetical protein
LPWRTLFCGGGDQFLEARVLAQRIQGRRTAGNQSKEKMVGLEPSPPLNQVNNQHDDGNHE